MSAYRKDFNKTKYMSFLIKNDEFLEEYNEIMKFGTKSARILKRDLIVNLHTMINI